MLAPETRVHVPTFEHEQAEIILIYGLDLRQEALLQSLSGRSSTGLIWPESRKDSMKAQCWLDPESMKESAKAY